MKTLAIFLLLSLSSLAQRDINNMTFVFFVETIDTNTKYSVFEVTHREILENGMTYDELKHIDSINIYNYADGWALDLRKNVSYKITFECKDKENIIYIIPDEEEPKHYSSIYLELTKDLLINVNYDPRSREYLVERSPLPQIYH